MEAQEQIKTLLWLGESAGFWLQTGAIFLSAVAAIFVIYHNGKMSKRRATIDHIIHHQANGDLLISIKQVYALHDQNVQLSGFVQQPDSVESKAILKVLNNHEFVALGIRRGAFEDKIYKDLQYSNFMKVYKASAGFIAELRREHSCPTFFQEFEWLIKRWEKNPLKKHT